MLVGVPKEIKVHEYRVGLPPSGVRELSRHGHQIVIETDAGAGITCSDDDYIAAGAEIASTADEIFERAELIVKVKEPQPDECRKLSEGQVLFTYLHLASDAEQTKLLSESGVTAIAYETVTDNRGHLPLLSPMSEVAGRMSVQAGAHCLERENGGKGILLGGVPGVEPASVVVIGGGVVGTNAVMMAMGLGAQVTVLDSSLDRLRELDHQFGSHLNTVFSTMDAIETHVVGADLVIGGVLIPGAAAPKLVTEDMVRAMAAGSVMVDVAIDQGGCFETSRPTTHADPTYVTHDVVHYCVTNMPGGVPRTSTFALNNATLPFTLALADKGVADALRDDRHLLAGLNVHQGKITHPAVANDLDYSYCPPEDAIGV